MHNYKSEQSQISNTKLYVNFMIIIFIIKQYQLYQKQRHMGSEICEEVGEYGTGKWLCCKLLI